MAGQLHDAGISIEVDEQTSRFARLNDFEQNPIKLWEPVWWMRFARRACRFEGPYMPLREIRIASFCMRD